VSARVRAVVLLAVIPTVTLAAGNTILTRTERVQPPNPRDIAAVISEGLPGFAMLAIISASPLLGGKGHGRTEAARAAGR